ncbi:hypothetical protein CSKR_201092 [Clonorchis sinensis]|uniref:Uncharacterized protein n=2 Tax=Clonorchis sinensis TaxID=79923 RepID=G7YBF8_CLOSI|nr:hypothetical protein CSKR_201092 [Clonorchis sinensis]GAA50292.1 hypothetical protein CLF_104336 [Clonorchis sinensis]
MVRPAGLSDVSRRRGLWFECALENTPLVGECSSLFKSTLKCPLNDNGKSIIRSRMLVPVMQVLILVSLFTTIVTMIVVIVLLWTGSISCGYRCGQYVMVIGGSVIWICALLYFVTIILQYHTLTTENYLFDPSFFSPRSTWLPKVRDATTMRIGPEMAMALATYYITFLSSASFLAAGTLVEA